MEHLEGWKGIARYMGVTERSAQNWATRHHMPVHHYPGKKGRAFALVNELERWKLSGPKLTSKTPRIAITVRFSEDEMRDLVHLLSATKFATMQGFISYIVGEFVKRNILEEHVEQHRSLIQNLKS